jgi:hypothetical protein
MTKCKTFFTAFWNLWNAEMMNKTGNSADCTTVASGLGNCADSCNKATSDTEYETYISCHKVCRISSAAVMKVAIAAIVAVIAFVF